MRYDPTTIIFFWLKFKLNPSKTEMIWVCSVNPSELTIYFETIVQHIRYAST